MRIYVDLTNKTKEDAMLLKEKMGCKKDVEVYRALIVAGIEAKKKEFKM